MNPNQKKILRNIIAVLFILGLIWVINYLREDETKTSFEKRSNDKQTNDLNIQAELKKKLPDLPQPSESYLVQKQLNKKLPDLPKSP